MQNRLPNSCTCSQYRTPSGEANFPENHTATTVPWDASLPQLQANYPIQFLPSAKHPRYRSRSSPSQWLIVQKFLPAIFFQIQQVFQCQKHTIDTYSRRLQFCSIQFRHDIDSALRYAVPQGVMRTAELVTGL